jgi:hypothetical protein
MFSLSLFVRLRKSALSQRVETCNGVKWRLASPGDSEGPAKPTLSDGNVLTERRAVRTARGEIRLQLMKRRNRMFSVNSLTLRSLRVLSQQLCKSRHWKVRRENRLRKRQKKHEDREKWEMNEDVRNERIMRRRFRFRMITRKIVKRSTSWGTR